MNRTSTLLSFCGVVLCGTALVYGCGDDDDNPGSSTSSSSSSSTSGNGSSSSSSSSSSSGAVPDAGTKPPALGAQIDRFGRPAINTAANGTFEADAATAGAKKDAYNANATRTTWSQYVPEIQANLGIYDGLDTVCGNQAFSDAGPGGHNPARYSTLASVLADDRQWLNTAGTTASQYLAVELNGTGAVPNTDRGGRTLAMDVIDITYNVVGNVPVGGVLTDGVEADAVKTAATAFPYLVPSTQ